MIFIILAAFAVTLNAGSASAGDWRFVTGNDEFVVLTDESSVRGSRTKTFWNASIYEEGRPFNGKRVDIVLRRTEMNCDSHETRDMQVVFRQANGESIYHDDTPTVTTGVVPGSSNDWLWKAVCENDYIGDAPVRFDDPSQALRILRDR